MSSLMTTFALEVENSWARKVANLISETWNAANDVIVFV